MGDRGELTRRGARSPRCSRERGRCSSKSRRSPRRPASARRSASRRGFDGRRLALLLAVLDKRAGLSFAQLDVFLNVVGGMRLQEPAGDLAVAAALASSVYDVALPADAIFIGEVGLGGEVRTVSQVERRVAEAANMGMKRVVSRASAAFRSASSRDVELVGVRTIQELLRRLFT